MFKGFKKSVGFAFLLLFVFLTNQCEKKIDAAPKITSESTPGEDSAGVSDYAYGEATPPISLAELKIELRKLLDNPDKRDAEFSHEALSIINSFENRTPDTSFYSIVNIDGIDPLDTLYNRVYITGDTVNVNSWWRRNGELLWSNDLVNPFSLYSGYFFEEYPRNPWLVFAIGIIDGRATIISEFEPLNFNGISYATDELYKHGFRGVDLENYMKNYKGGLLEYGHPETSSGLYFWHEPSKLFLLFYAP